MFFTYIEQPNYLKQNSSDIFTSSLLRLNSLSLINESVDIEGQAENSKQNVPKESEQVIDIVHKDPWDKLRQYTDARIALGHAGCSIPTKPLLKFQLDHAEAKDAVLQGLDIQTVIETLSKKLNLEIELLNAKFGRDQIDSTTPTGLKASNSEFRKNSPLLDNVSLHKIPLFTVTSKAIDKATYLKRPDWGRVLSSESSNMLESYGEDKNYDVVIVMGDGLSSRAITENAPSLVSELLTLFKKEEWKVAPLVIATGSRVALGDKIAHHLNAKMLVMLIGERPGLSSPDSLGIYYTLNAHMNSNDSMRNCISNVRPAGLPIRVAAMRLLELMRESKKLQYSGVNLKDNQETPIINNEEDIVQLL